MFDLLVARHGREHVHVVAVRFLHKLDGATAHKALEKVVPTVEWCHLPRRVPDMPLPNHGSGVSWKGAQGILG